MKFMRLNYLVGAFVISSALVLTSCSEDSSRSTGLVYNSSEYGGYESADFTEQETPPGMVFVQGGNFTMGRVEKDLSYEWNNNPRKVTVSSFYIDETEVTNQFYTEYLYWLGKVYGNEEQIFVYNKALPDTLVWRQKLGYMENYVENYLRHPAYKEYPVVGVNWLQAMDFCKWRTDRVNEAILIRGGFLAPNNLSGEQTAYDMDSYLNGRYVVPEDKKINKLPNLGSTEKEATRNIGIADGILLPRFRLPTEAEWEYAALGLIGNTFDEIITDRRLYPWNGNFIRNANRGGEYYGRIQDNFVRGRGDYMGVAGALNDEADATAPVFKYLPNDYGLYSMAGNVSEWVLDVYRPLTSMDENEFRPFRGNTYTTKVEGEDGVEIWEDNPEYDLEGIKSHLEALNEEVEETATESELSLLTELLTKTDEAILRIEEEHNTALAMEEFHTFLSGEMETEEAYEFLNFLKDIVSEYVTSAPGQIKTRNVRAEENLYRDNYTESNNINFLDGDKASSLKYSASDEYDGNADMYDWSNTTLITDRTRVYKGGSWRDRAYYTTPGTRRFLDERKSTATLGFRCSMDRLGSQVQGGSKKRK
ncbi:MAG: gliding motility-associated lipoprotein GldJ [Luteibaculaceae bacterium]|jgi:gliding motility-associated lipoprotein GldJ